MLRKWYTRGCGRIENASTGATAKIGVFKINFEEGVVSVISENTRNAFAAVGGLETAPVEPPQTTTKVTTPPPVTTKTDTCNRPTCNRPTCYRTRRRQRFRGIIK